MNIAFCAGGTLGHINPALSFINRIKDSNTKIIFITTNKDKKYKSISENKKIDMVYYLNVVGIPKNLLLMPKAISLNIKGLKIIKDILVKEKIDIVVGLGGYISGLSIYMANKLKLKTIIHEQNSVLGFANKINLKATNIILTSFDNTLLLKNNYYQKVRVIGNPRYIEAKNYGKSLYKCKNHLLITSGTLGSEQINNIMIEFINSPYLKDYTVTWITGHKYYDKVIEKTLKSSNVEIIPFSMNLLEEMSKAGIVISRAGSSTLFEILAFEIPAIVIPSPNVTHNHQYYNAKNMCDKGLVKMIEEKNFNFNLLIQTLNELKNEYNLYISNLKNFQLDDPNESFIREINKLKEEDKDG